MVTSQQLLFWDLLPGSVFTDTVDFDAEGTLSLTVVYSNAAPGLPGEDIHEVSNQRFLLKQNTQTRASGTRLGVR